MEKGYVHIYTGNGKGKTTAALGLSMRAVGAGYKVYFGEFIKGMEYSEVKVIRERFPEITIELFGREEGCMIDRKPTDEDVEAAHEGLQKAKAAMVSGDYDLVILDELTIPVSLGLLSDEDVLEVIDSKPQGVELVITGRYASDTLKEAADLVSEMKEIKHYFREGVLSRKGIDC